VLLVKVRKEYQFAAINGGPLRGIDPEEVVMGDPNETNPLLHTCFINTFNKADLSVRKQVKISD